MHHLHSRVFSLTIIHDFGKNNTRNISSLYKFFLKGKSGEERGKGG
jgi:hypothetical protein